MILRTRHLSVFRQFCLPSTVQFRKEALLSFSSAFILGNLLFTACFLVPSQAVLDKVPGKQVTVHVIAARVRMDMKVSYTRCTLILGEVLVMSALHHCHVRIVS